MKNSKEDIIAIVGKGAVGAIPFVGPMAAEIIGALIPNQRMDRLEQFLKELDLKMNQLIEIPSSFSNLKKLVSLDLKRNMLNEFPEAISGMDSLEFLDVRQNVINKIHSSIIH